MPRVRTDLTEDRIEAALRATAGIITAAALLLKCDPGTLRSRIKRSVHLQTVRFSLEEQNLDLAETELLKAVRAGKPWAVTFFLKCKGKARGWQERPDRTVVEHTGSIAITPEAVSSLSQADEDRLLGAASQAAPLGGHRPPKLH